MGHPLILQAMPAGSRLYALLQSDKRVGIIFARLFNAGGGPYSWVAMGEELDRSLDGIAESEPEFASRSEVDRAMADLLAGLEEACTGHPGLEGRRVFLNKTQWDIEDRLAQELRRRGRSDADEFTHAILFGAGLLTPPGVEGFLGDGLRVVPAPLVRDAARALRGTRAEGLFDPACEESVEHLCADYRAFQALYWEAAGYDEAVIVGD